MSRTTVDFSPYEETIFERLIPAVYATKAAAIRAGVKRIADEHKIKISQV